MNSAFRYRFHCDPDEFKDDAYMQYLLASNSATAFLVDRMRLLCLQREGGVYVDADCVAVRPLSTLGVFDDEKADFLFGMRSPDRLGVGVHGPVSLVDNTVLGSAQKGRLIARLIELYHPNGKLQNGATVGLHILRCMGPDTRVFGFRYFYGEQRYPETVFDHDACNLASWCKK